MWCPRALTDAYGLVTDILTSTVGALLMRIAFFVYFFMPTYVNSLTIGAMSLERYLLICRPTSAKHTWFFQHRKILYSVLTVLIIVVPLSISLIRPICYVTPQPRLQKCVHRKHYLNLKVLEELNSIFQIVMQSYASPG